MEKMVKDCLVKILILYTKFIMIFFSFLFQEEIRKSAETMNFQNTFFFPINLQPALDLVYSLKDVVLSSHEKEM